MDFTLIYRGPLPAVTSGNTRAREKQLIRRELSHQLAELWRVTPALKGIVDTRGIGKGERVNGRLEATPRDTPHSFLELGGLRFVPLVQRKIRLDCGLYITFLRRGVPGSVVHGGDLDNRLKTLLDALRMPQSVQELVGESVASDERPPEYGPANPSDCFFCLLEDDSLVTSLAVETHQLLLPVGEGDRASHVDLLIRVTLKPADPTLAALAYL